MGILSPQKTKTTPEYLPADIFDNLECLSRFVRDSALSGYEEVVLPSPVVLANHFGVTTLQMLDMLMTLKDYGLAYEIRGLDTFITLKTADQRDLFSKLPVTVRRYWDEFCLRRPASFCRGD